MNTANFCAQCGNRLVSGDQFCSKCGSKVDSSVSPSQVIHEKSQSLPMESPKSSKKTLLLCIFFGMLGVHRFYVGKIGTGLLMLISGGGLGIWVLIDLILIVRNKFEDKKGRPLELTHNLSQNKETIFILGALLSWLAVVILSTLAMLLYMTSDLVTTVNEQLSALRTGQIDKAYSYTSKGFKKTTPLESFKLIVDQFPPLKNNASSNFNERSISNGTGILGGTLTAKDGTNTAVIYQLIKEDGQWKILNIKVVPPAVNHKLK